MFVAQKVPFTGPAEAKTGVTFKAWLVRACLLGVAGLGLAGLSAGPARAADGAVPADGWAGLYLGGSVGGHITTNDWTTSALTAYDFVRVNDATARADLGRTAARIGVYGGVNIPVTDRILLGIEVDVAGTPGGDKSVDRIPGTGAAFTGADRVTTESNFDGSLGGRAGYLVTPDVLVFATAGLALQNVKYSVSCPGGAVKGTWCGSPEAGGETDLRPGWTLGGGVEARVFDHLLARVAYRYADFGSHRLDYFIDSPLGLDQVGARVALKTHVAYAGLAYKF